MSVNDMKATRRHICDVNQHHTQKVVMKYSSKTADERSELGATTDEHTNVGKTYSHATRHRPGA